MNRRLALALVVLAALAASGAWWWQHRGGTANQGRAPAMVETARSPPAPRARLTGTVRLGSTPVTGAEVSLTATRPIDHELPSHCEEACGLPLWSNECPEAAAQLLAVAGNLAADAVVLAHARSGADGSFALDSPTDGPFSVWASAPDGGIALAEGLEPGANVALSLAPAPPLFGRVLDDAHHAVSQARVTAISAEHARSFETTTDAAGAFRFEALPGDDWAVVAWHAGLLPAHEVATPRADRPLTLSLASPRRIAGEVTFGGRPVSAAQVSLKGMHRVLTAAAGPRGQFTFDGLRPGTYVLAVTEEERAGTLEVPVYPGLDSTELVLELHAALTVTGTVRDTDNHPIAGAQVSLTGEDSEPTAPAISQSDGTFELRDVAPGPWLVRGTAAGFQPASPVPLVAMAGRRTPVELRLRRAALLSGVVIDERGAPVSHAELIATTTETDAAPASAFTTDAGTFTFDTLSPATWELSVEHERFVPARATVRAPSGSVRLTLSHGATISGVVLDDRGVPQNDTTVSAFCTSPGESLERELVTGKDGRFSLGGLFEGEWVVGATRNGRAAVARVGLTNTSLAQVTLRFGRGESLSGKVVDQRGRPVAEATVVAESSLASGHRIPGKRELREAMLDDLLKLVSRAEVRTGDDGSFELRDLLPGTYLLAASKEGFMPFKDAQPVRPGTHGARLVLTALTSLTGRVVDTRGQPIPGFEIDHSPHPSPTGQFSVPVFGLGVHHLQFSAPGFASTERTVTLESRADKSLGDVVLSRGHTVVVSVLDAITKAPLAGAVIRSALLAADSVTGADGRATLSRVDEAQVPLTITRPGYRPLSVTLASRDLRLDVELDPGAQLSGSVAEAGPDARVIADDGEQRLSSPVGPDGHYALAGLSPGAWVVEPVGSAHRPFLAVRVQLSAREQRQLDFAPRAKGASVTLSFVEPGEPALFLDWVLLPAQAQVPTSQLQFSIAMQTGLKPRLLHGDEVVEAVAPGSYTLLVTRGYGSKVTLYQQALEVSGDAVLDVRLPADSPVLPP